jgi:hypothetical protein
LRVVQVDCGDVAALGDGDGEEDEVEKEGDADASDDYPAVETAVGDAEEEEGHGEFEEALIEEVEGDAENAEL